MRFFMKKVLEVAGMVSDFRFSGRSHKVLVVVFLLVVAGFLHRSQRVLGVMIWNEVHWDELAVEGFCGY